MAVEAVELADGRPVLTTRGAQGTSTLRCRIVVGADGPHSIVARAAGVARPSRLPERVGLSYHLADPRPEGSHDARLRVFDGGYVGIAPVPGGRVNIGIVLGRAWRERLAREGASAVADAVVAAVPPADDDPGAWRAAERCDQLAGAAPLGGRVTRRAGPGWFLVGDAVGFLDPFTGEGLHRALVSTELAAAAIRAALATAGAGGPGRRRLRPRDAPPVRRQGRGVLAGPGLPRPARAVRVRGPAARRPTGRSCDDGSRDG